MTSRFMTGLLLLLTLTAFLLSLMAGKVWIWPRSWAADNADGWIFLELRLPRALLGLCIGAVLGLSGAVLQGYLRNPLADPTVLGVSASAALGGVLAIFLGINLVPFGLFGCAMIGAGASILLLLAIGRGGGPIGFILGGMVLSTLAGALTAFVISIAPNPFAASEIINWLMGALTDRLMQDVLTALRLKSTLSEIEDLDYAEAVTRMNKEMMALEAAMGSFSKISGLSLFDYIRG